MRTTFLKSLGILAAILLFAACSKGGELVIDPNARVVKSKGSPYVSINQGGKALLVEQGQTPATGVHGWVTIQAVSGRNVASGTGHQMTLNKANTYH